MIWYGKETTGDEIFYLPTFKYKNTERHRRPVLPNTVLSPIREWLILPDGKRGKQHY
jgi:hypothetical protein